MNVKIYQMQQEFSDKFISQKIMFIQLSMKLDKSCDNECKKGPQKLNDNVFQECIP